MPSIRRRLARPDKLRSNTNERPSRTSHAELIRNLSSKIAPADGQADSHPIYNCGTPELITHSCHQGQRRNIYSVEERARRPPTAGCRNERPADGHQEERRKKYPNRSRRLAPTGPRSRYRRKVAVVKTGPGVTCPMATASTSCASVIHARCTTRSVLRNASQHVAACPIRQIQSSENQKQRPHSRRKYFCSACASDGKKLRQS